MAEAGTDWAAADTGRAEELARRLLADSLPIRWAHTRGVATRAMSLTGILRDQASLLQSAAWLHDIGYSPHLVDSGFHPLDGARYLRLIGGFDDMACRLVAHHSCAVIEADERGLEATLRREFEPPPGRLAAALTYCDMTTSPDGRSVTVEDRIAEILCRYGSGDVISRFINRAAPLLIETTCAIAKELSGPQSVG